MQNLKAKIIILVGPPGSGKGTQAELLTQRLNLRIIHLSQLIREKFKKEPDNPDVIESKKAYEEGRLTNGKIVAKWVAEKINRLGEKEVEKGLVLDGAARTIEETTKTIELLDEIVGKENIKVFFIKISPEETIKRNTKRVICQKCLKPIDPKLIGKIEKCPYCGGRLGKREMDQKNIIENRLRVYREKTLPSLQYIKEQKMLIEVDGEQPIEKVYQDILKHLI